MTDHESNPFADDVLKVLRERARTQAPAAARTRVAARLTAAGAGVLTGAAAAAAASTKAAGSAAALSGLALSKTFALGLVIGVGTSVGAYSIASLGQHDQPHAAGAAIVGSSVGATPRAPRPMTARSVALPLATSSAASVSAPVNPTPELPRASRAPATEASRAPADPSRGLAEQLALLDGAASLLRRGDPAGALDAVQRHSTRFPRSLFEEEREALAIRALVASGDRAAARVRTEAFSRRFSRSLALSALQKAVGANQETVTEPSPLPQTHGEGSALR
jgi:hypothetical protein